MFKSLICKYKHGILFLYAFIYIPWFMYLEKTVVSEYHVIHMKLDDYIPFNEIFIVPYMLWFLYIGLTVLYFFFTDVKEFKKLCLFLFTGMTIFLIISTVYPNGHNLRPAYFAEENIFTMAVKKLYATDTSTNLFPSIHVFNSVASCIAIANSEKLKMKKWVQTGALILTVSIVCSTVFLKQHSIFDVFTALGLIAVLYPLIYRTEYVISKIKAKSFKPESGEQPEHNTI